MINMIEEEVIIQTADEVSIIDYMKNTNDVINGELQTAQDNMNIITEQLSYIQDNISPVAAPEAIEVDTSVVEAHTQDILLTINQQQEQINTIEEKIDLILNRLDEMI